MRSSRLFLLVSLAIVLPVTAFVIGDEPKSEAAKLTSVVVQDFEKPELKPEIWVVNIPGENAKVQLSADHSKEGQQCLKLHYHFLAGGNVQYLGIPHKTKIQAPVHQLHFMLYGDNSKCSYAVQISDASGETHQYGKSSGEGGVIDFKDWKEIAINLDVSHETWGGDKNNKLEYPITAITLIIGQPIENDQLQAAEGDLYFDALRVDSEKSVDETLGCQVAVVSPEYCSEVKGNTPIKLAAPGFKSVTVKCWKQGEKFGTDSTVAEVTLDAKGEGSFVFPADEYPHGPVMVRITGVNGAVKDNCYLQLYNRGGISWSEGIPKAPPAAAKGMRLVFEDDFTKLPTISGKDPKATYYDHKPPHGYQDFSVHVFTDHESPKTPFAQMDSYLRIRATDKTRTSGLISSMKNDGQGTKVSAPCYFEARFIGPNAIGTWPGFWLMTDYMTNYKLKGDKTPCDELDIIEAYGGEGPGSPNAYDTYMTTPHCWNQGDVGKELETKAFKAMHNPIRMKKFGIPSTWFEGFHIYGCKITKTETVYYCDDIEVARHETLPLSKEQPLFFMINLATGGGWPVDLSRYNGTTDMYIDYVRVYKE